jgi:AraC-like DNA-binding protein
MFSFSTDVLPRQERFEVYREEVVRKAFHWDIASQTGSDCRFAVRVRTYGSAQNATCDATPSLYSRGRRELHGGSDGYMLVVNRTGRYRVSHAGHDADLALGAATLLDHSRPASIHLPEPGQCWSVFLDRAALFPLLSQADDAAGREIGAGNPALRLLINYIETAESIGPISDPALQQLIGTHIVDMVAAAVGANDADAEMIAHRGIKAGRLAELRAEIARSASDCSLTSSMIAARIGVSERYLRRMLEETGQSFTEHLLENRLQLAWRRLKDPRHDHKKVSEIAYEAGFNDISYFNRSFRRRFGATPSDVRLAARKRSE